MVVSAALAVLALSGSESLTAVYALALAGGVALVFDAPGRHALTFQLVGRDELPNAVALNSALFNASRVTGPAVAGVVIAAVGVGICFAVNAVSFLAVLAGLLLMRVEELHPLERKERPGWLRGMREGLAYAKRTPQVRLILLMVGAISTVGFNFHVILPLLASDTLHAGPEVFGLLSACFGGGALLGALLAAGLGRASWKALVAGTTGFSVTMVALGLLESVPAASVLLFATGVCFTLWTANSNSILQLAAPDHLRGRVVAMFLFAFAGMAPVGGVLAGWLVEVGGTQLAFLVAGGTTAAITAVACTRRPFARPQRAVAGDPEPAA
jgi:MFS family permease